MKSFNVTAQAYRSDDSNKQTLLINDVIISQSKETAINNFYGMFPEYEILKIYSVEEIPQVAS